MPDVLILWTVCFVPGAVLGLWIQGTKRTRIGIGTIVIVAVAVAAWTLARARQGDDPTVTVRNQSPIEIDPEVMRVAPLIGILQRQNAEGALLYCRLAAIEGPRRPVDVSVSADVVKRLGERRRQQTEALCKALLSALSKQQSVDEKVKSAPRTSESSDPLTVAAGLQSFQAFEENSDLDAPEDSLYRAVHVGPFATAEQCAEVEAIAHASLLPTTRCSPTAEVALLGGSITGDSWRQMQQVKKSRQP